MNTIESEGNTSLIYDSSKMSAIYQDRIIDLWGYAIEEEGYSDNWVGWETDKKFFFQYADAQNVNWYGEVINNKGIIIVEWIFSSKIQYYNVWEFSLNDGGVHRLIYQEPSGKFESYSIRGTEYPEDEYLVKAPDGSFAIFNHPNGDREYQGLGGSGDGTSCKYPTCLYS